MHDQDSVASNTETNPGEPFPGQAGLGSILLFLGAGLFLLALIDRSAGLPFPMPRFWFVNRSLWVFLAVALFTGGCALLRKRPLSTSTWKPTEPGVRFHKLRFYTRDGCHLCDQAKDLLLKYTAYLPEIDEIRIDDDDQLVEEFSTCVPVVRIDGKIRFRGGIDEVLLRRLIEGTRPSG